MRSPARRWMSDSSEKDGEYPGEAKTRFRGSRSRTTKAVMSFVVLAIGSPRFARYAKTRSPVTGSYTAAAPASIGGGRRAASASGAAFASPGTALAAGSPVWAAAGAASAGAAAAIRPAAPTARSRDLAVTVAA